MCPAGEVGVLEDGEVLCGETESAREREREINSPKVNTMLTFPTHHRAQARSAFPASVSHMVGLNEMSAKSRHFLNGLEPGYLTLSSTASYRGTHRFQSLHTNPAATAADLVLPLVILPCVFIHCVSPSLPLTVNLQGNVHLLWKIIPKSHYDPQHVKIPFERQVSSWGRQALWHKALLP